MASTESGHTTDDLLGCASSGKPEDKRGETKKEDSQAKQILILMNDNAVELFHDAEPKPYITIPVGEHRETYLLESRVVRRWLAYQYYQRHGSAPSPNAVNMARLTLEGQALFEGKQHEVHIRVAEDRGAIILDLCDEHWRVIRIDAAGWNVLPTSPVRFRRSAGMLPLPVPERGGSLSDLQMFLNVQSEADLILVTSWLVAAARNRGPCPVLGLHGEQGSAKSTASRVLRRLIDPNKSEIRAEPREARDLVIAANNSWVIALDNLSHIPPWLSDSLCRLATGGGFSTRTLYTDADEMIFEAQRPILVNGIEELAVRGDLADRSIILTLPRIKEKGYRTESQFWMEFEAARPHLLGALLDAVSMALRRLPEVSVEEPTRMADFTAWVVAAEPALPWEPGTFVKAYKDNRKSANEVALEASPVAMELMGFISETYPWSGSCKDLLAELERRATEGTKKLPSWPKTPRKLAGVLRRLGPNLRASGIEIELGGKEGRGRDRHRVVRIRLTSQPSPSSPPTPDPETDARMGTYDGSGGDGQGDGCADKDANRPHNRPSVSTRNPSEGDDGAGGDGSVGDPGTDPNHDVSPEDEWGSV